MSSAQGSISFDHAASFYDSTRALSPDAAGRITELLIAELAGNDLVLEVGVGTGRVALPLVQNGVAMVGIDLARGMLDKLIANAAGGPSPVLVQGDATRLPFPDGGFDAAIASWVLHLVTGWRDVVGELVRVLRPGGRFLVDAGSEHRSITTRLTWQFRDIAGVTDWPRGIAGYRELDEVLIEVGARPRELAPVIETTEMALEDHIARLERGVYSVTWGVDEQTRKRTAAELRHWAENEYGSLTQLRTIETIHIWRAYDL